MNGLPSLCGTASGAPMCLRTVIDGHSLRAGRRGGERRAVQRAIGADAPGSRPLGGRRPAIGFCRETWRPRAGFIGNRFWGFPRSEVSDSRCWLELEASQDVPSIFAESSRARCLGGSGWGELPRGGEGVQGECGECGEVGRSVSGRPAVPRQSLPKLRIRFEVDGSDSRRLCRWSRCSPRRSAARRKCWRSPRRGRP